MVLLPRKFVPNRLMDVTETRALYKLEPLSLKMVRAWQNFGLTRFKHLYYNLAIDTKRRRLMSQVNEITLLSLDFYTSWDFHTRINQAVDIESMQHILR